MIRMNVKLGICNQLKAQAACTLQLIEMVPGLILVGVATSALLIAIRGASNLCTTGAVLYPSITVTSCPRQTCREAAQSRAFFLASLKALLLAWATQSVLLVRSKEIPLRIIPLTTATPSMIFPRVVVLVPTMGTVTVRLSLAICPTTVDTPLENVVLGYTLREETQQLLLVSPLAVSTPSTELILVVSWATAALTVSAPTVTCRLIVAVSGAACTVADPYTVIVLSVQQTCDPTVCMQVLMGELMEGLMGELMGGLVGGLVGGLMVALSLICAYPTASRTPRRNTFGTVMIRLQMEKLISNIRWHRNHYNQQEIFQLICTDALVVTFPQGTCKACMEREYLAQSEQYGTQLSTF